MSELLLTSGLSGGGDIQFSRPGFKIAVQFNTGGVGPTMNYDGYAHYRTQGMRCLWNYYDTSTTISPTLGQDGITWLATNTYVWPSGFGNHAELFPLMDMLYMDCENSGLLWDANDANDTTCSGGNGGVSGTTLTIASGTTSGLVRGARISGAGLSADAYLTSTYGGGTVNFTPAAAVADGTTISVQGRINDTANLRTAVNSTLATYGASSKLIGAYSGGPSGYLGYDSYAFWTAAGASTKIAIAATKSANDVCGQYITPYYDFCLPELYTTQMENVSATSQFWISEKVRRGSNVPIFPIMWPTAGASSEHAYDTCMTYLEYMIRCPELDGCAFWAVNGTHLPSAAPTWYDDGTFPWITAIQDFITKYGLSA